MVTVVLLIVALILLVTLIDEIWNHVKEVRNDKLHNTDS